LRCVKHYKAGDLLDGSAAETSFSSSRGDFLEPMGWGDADLAWVATTGFGAKRMGPGLFNPCTCPVF